MTYKNIVMGVLNKWHGKKKKKKRLNLNLIKLLDPTTNYKKQRGHKNILDNHHGYAIMKIQIVGNSKQESEN